MLIVKFDDALFYTSSNENDRLIGATNRLPLEFPHLFWKVENSSLTTEFKRQGAHIRRDENVCHFCFAGCNQFVDVLSLAEPVFNTQ
ncbi:MAG: hypothetical protein ACK5ME_08205 [Parahaliea sp.]